MTHMRACVTVIPSLKFSVSDNVFRVRNIVSFFLESTTV